MAEFKRVAGVRIGGGGILLWTTLDDDCLPAGAGFFGGPLLVFDASPFLSLRAFLLEGDAGPPEFHRGRFDLLGGDFDLDS